MLTERYGCSEGGRHSTTWHLKLEMLSGNDSVDYLWVEDRAGQCRAGQGRARQDRVSARPSSSGVASVLGYTIAVSLGVLHAVRSSGVSLTTAPCRMQWPTCRNAVLLGQYTVWLDAASHAAAERNRFCRDGTAWQCSAPPLLCPSDW